MSKQHQNHPFFDVLKGAEKRIKAGWTVFQKFSCEKCLARLTMPEPNKFWTMADCDQCGHVTDIMKTGCNYMAMWSNDQDKLKQLIVAVRSEYEAEEVQRKRGLN